MALEDIIKFQLKRINPFPGLTIDADMWQEAHSYHRDQQRLHILAFHDVGIIEGLEVIANDPPDLSVMIQPGVAVDPEGNIIIVSQPQHYQLKKSNKGTIYLVIQFREVPAGPYQPAEGGQATRILEAYRIQETEKLPDEPHLELARIDLGPEGGGAIRDAKAKSRPGVNEINLSFRREAKSAAPTSGPPVVPEKTGADITEVTGSARETVTVGHKVLGAAGKDLHCTGWRNLVGEVIRQGKFAASFNDNVPLNKSINQYTLVYLTGNGGFELTTHEQAALGGFLQSGGIIFGEGCSEGQQETESKGAKEFGLAFNQLASQLNCKLESVQRGHTLLSVVNVFSGVPQGAAAGMVLEGGHMIYSGSDYGCAWQGGHQDQPLPRDIIRSSFEMGTNIVAYAQTMKAAGH
ncbi:MAG TPA: DUF4159 domain-containing protein [Dehalococcoidia bacterium]|nr:DUF4159 domain-containing protein [Dehalococcoidia bacterium]